MDLKPLRNFDFEISGPISDSFSSVSGSFSSRFDRFGMVSSRVQQTILNCFRIVFHYLSASVAIVTSPIVVAVVVVEKYC